MTNEELIKILEGHKAWLKNGRGSKGKRAYLRNANLEGAYLEGVDLRNADLRNANLLNADLLNANLLNANLLNANLRNADLRNANLRNANLDSVNLEGTKLPIFSIVPQEGSFIGWKKVGVGEGGRTILKLRIEDDAKRTSSLVGRKCRASKVTVLAAYYLDDTERSVKDDYYSLHDMTFTYRVGQTLEVPDFDDDIRVECARGLHFFLTREEAKEY